MHRCQPQDLVLSSVTLLPTLHFQHLTIWTSSSIAFSIFTGDIVSHDPEDTLSQDYVAYEEEITYLVFKRMLGNTPVYAALGNHDTLPVSFNTQHSMDPDPKNSSSNVYQWNYDLVSSLWLDHSWLNDSEASFARTHYGAYATTTAQGLRVISLHSDFWYKANIFNYWNVTNPDQSGILKWLADELSACEKRGQRAWIIAHVLTGFDGTAPLPNPTALFYSIVRRFSPATIAAVFFGHTHQDQFQIFYDYLPSSLQSSGDSDRRATLRDTTRVDFNKPLQIDSKTFSVMNSQTFIANISNSLSWKKPVWEFEYDTRQAYSETTEDRQMQNPEGIQWPTTSPLNATFWHLVTERMQKAPESSSSSSPSLLELYNMYESKSSSAKTRRGNGNITPEQKVCFLRASSGWLGQQCKEHSGTDARGAREKAFGMV
ncbi:hypothetical protein CLAIMM_06400 [Cladophialophora immunda]|nr:hypothetical protein CLAIMM_06400 [Cladophialophora immunda]